jgi:hypothetical protein
VNRFLRPIGVAFASVGAISIASCQGAVRSLPQPGCGPMPTVYLPPADLYDDASTAVSPAMDLAVNETDLYVAINDAPNARILRVPLGGGPAQTVGNVDGVEQAMIFAGGYLVYASLSINAEAGGDGGEVVRVGLDGSNPTVLYSGLTTSLSYVEGLPGILASDGTAVYIATERGVLSVPLAGGTPTTLTTQVGPIALNGPNLLVAAPATDFGRSSTLYSVPTSGGPTAAVVTVNDDIDIIVRCGDSMCIVSDLGALQAVDSSGAVTMLAQGAALTAVYRMLYDGTQFFVTTIGNTTAVNLGSLLRVPASGGTPVSGGEGSGIAVDSACLYVADIDYGVYGVAKAQWGTAPTFGEAP